MTKDANLNCMRKAIGFLIVLFALSVYFESALAEPNNTATATFKTATTAAKIAETKLNEI